MLIVNAPTGFGKTAAVIYGLLEAGAEKVLYVVRTVNELDPVIRELKSFDATFTFLFSARRSCPLFRGKAGEDLSPEEFWENCRLARLKGLCNFYMNLENVDRSEIWNYVKNHYSYHATRIAKDLAKHLSVCPFFALRSLIEDSMFIVAVYPYLFRKDIFEYFLEPYKYEDLVIVVDEAHSLLDAQTLLERTITPSIIKSSIGEIKLYLPEAKDIIKALEEVLEKLSRIRPTSRVRLLDKKLFRSILEVKDQIYDVTEEIRRRKFEKALLERGRTVAVSTPLYKLLLWLDVASLEGSKVFVESNEGNEVKVRISPIDPARVASEPLEKAKAVILLSGTMPPGEFVEEVLGVRRRRTYFDVEMSFGPMVPRDHIYTVVSIDVTTRYRERSTEMFRRIANYITIITREIAGPKLIVYPSYDIMREVASKLPVDIPLILEGKGTSLEEARLKVEEDMNVVVNAVAGGKLVEGIEFVDYEGNNLLHVVIIVGVPYPQPDDYTKEQLSLLSSRIGSARARYYIYDVKAVIRVRQALGRAIRGPEDRAVYFLLDRRYINKKIRRLIKLPYNKIVSSSEELSEVLERAKEVLS